MLGTGTSLTRPSRAGEGRGEAAAGVRVSSESGSQGSRRSRECRHERRAAQSPRRLSTPRIGHCVTSCVTPPSPGPLFAETFG